MFLGCDACYLYLPMNYLSALIMEAVYFSEITVRIYQNTLRPAPQGSCNTEEIYVFWILYFSILYGYS